MTLFASFLDKRKLRAAIALAVVLHAVVLFGFAQYSRNGHALHTRPVDTAAYQPIEVVFTSAATAPASIAPLARPTKPRSAVAPAMQHTATIAPAVDSRAQPAAALDTPTLAAATPPISVEQASRENKPVLSSSRADETRQDVQPMQAAKPDYAYNPQPDYPLLLREQGVGGVVWLRVWVDSDGHPGEIKLARGSGYRLLDDSALRAVRQWRFVPAKKGDQRLASWVEFPIRFTLNG
jgi:protein TonB